MKIWISLATLAIILISSSLVTVSAELGYTCIGDSSFYNWTEDGVVHNMTTPCALGCDDGQCRGDASSGNYAIAFILAYVAFAALMAYIGMNINREQHGHIQILFLFLSLYSALSAIVGLQVMTDMLNIPNLGSINNVVIIFFPWFLWFMLGYMIIVFVFNLLRALREWFDEKKAERRGGLSPLKK